MMRRQRQQVPGHVVRAWVGLPAGRLGEVVGQGVPVHATHADAGLPQAVEQSFASFLVVDDEGQAEVGGFRPLRWRGDVNEPQPSQVIDEPARVVSALAIDCFQPF